MYVSLRLSLSYTTLNTMTEDAKTFSEPFSLFTRATFKFTLLVSACAGSLMLNAALNIERGLITLTSRYAGVELPTQVFSITLL